MIWIDYTLSGIVSICLFLGVLRGVKYELYSLVVWLLALGVGLIFCREFSGFLENWVAKLPLRMMMAFLCLLAITLVLGGIIGYLLGDSLGNPSLFDRVLGMGVGGLRGLLMVTVIVLLAGLTSLPSEPWWHEAQLIFPFQKAASNLRDSFPSALANYIQYQ